MPYQQLTNCKYSKIKYNRGTVQIEYKTKFEGFKILKGENCGGLV